MGVTWRRIAVAALCLVALAGFLVPSGRPALAAADDELVALARAGRGKVLIADFGLGLCRQCKAQKAILDKVVEAYHGKVVVRMVHVNKEQALAEKYGVEMIPHLVFFDATGKVAFKKSGKVMSYDEIACRLERMEVKP